MNRLISMVAFALLEGVGLVGAQPAPASTSPNSSAKTAAAADTVSPTLPAVKPKSIHDPIVIFDFKTIETLKGKVIEVGNFPKSAIRLQLKTDKDTIAVQLGPESFLRSQSVQLKARDWIEVTGSRVKLGGKPAIVAAQIKKGKQILVLRDARGVPAWKAARQP
ncbi:MAG: hypothetical protein FJY95_21665 [Candidatus Handelsmanbacteria bacterium]|nr:hypothetical protein [Candidatus Handelsmanbacteria bacterium]